MSHRVLGVLILVWAAATWGGRISLLVDADPTAVMRVAVSILAAIAAGAVLIRGTARGRSILWTYAVVTAAVWISSLVSVWRNDHQVGFRLVHTALAAVSLALALAAVRARAVPESG